MTWTAGSWVQARCITRLGPRRLVRSGQCLVLGGLGLMGAGRRGHGRGLCAPIGDHPRSRCGGRRRQGHVGSPALRRARPGHRNGGGGCDRGWHRRRPGAPPGSGPGVFVRDRDRCYRAGRRSAASRPADRFGSEPDVIRALRKILHILDQSDLLHHYQ
jgi:hypothetical protein